METNKGWAIRARPHSYGQSQELETQTQVRLQNCTFCSPVSTLLNKEHWTQAVEWKIDLNNDSLNGSDAESETNDGKICLRNAPGPGDVFVIVPQSIL